uniref:Uncharacterized protein n=1 Tax=Engystomops pustulosus TaxID=76066 RepID=A0AAV6YKW1_ENGPU|nr:hypothetical protein GDO81_026711 [Engystomops pustulosus]
MSTEWNVLSCRHWNRLMAESRHMGFLIAGQDAGREDELYNIYIYMIWSGITEILVCPIYMTVIVTTSCGQIPATLEVNGIL